MRKIVWLQWEDRENLPSIVYKIDWVVEITEQNITHAVKGIFQCDNPNPENFIPLNELTEEIVLSWFPEGFWEPHEASVQALLDAELNPPNNKGEGLPWIQ